MDYTLDKSLVKSSDVSVIHTQDGFYTEHNGIREKAVITTNSPLFKMSPKQVKSLIKTKSYLTVEKMPNGQHKLTLNNKVKGGGLFGAAAGVWLGAFAVNAVCYGSIALVSGGIGIFCPPLGVAVGVGLSATLTAPIQVAATTVAIGTGVVGGVITGPL